MDAKETKERMLFIHESPSGEQMSSSMEKRTFQSDNMTSTSEVRATTNGVPVWGLPQGIPPPPPPRQYHSHATANYNTGSVESQTSRNFSTSSMQQSSSSQQKSLRRHQSDSSTFVNGDNYNTTGREVATAQIRGGQTTGMSGNGYHRERVQQVVTINEGDKCTCCPYGYHVDLDFVNYCESLADGSYLTKLKRIQREKRKLRKSMEFFLQQQENQEQSSPPPDLVQNVNVQATAFLKNIEYKDSATNKVLEEIDSSVDQTLHSIDSMIYTTKAHSQLVSSDDDTSPSSNQNFNTFPMSKSYKGQNIEDEVTTQNFSLREMGRSDSKESLSSISTMASDVYNLVPVKVSGFAQMSGSNSSDNFSKVTHITTEELEYTMATHLPSEESTTTNISKSSMETVRKTMESSLQRIKELEEQVKAIPVLQVRISVLKEEKRLLMLQQKARNQKLNTRTVGVGDHLVIPPPTPKSPPPTLPKPKVKSVGVGDHNVIEVYLLQPDLSPTCTIHDNEKFFSETTVIERDHYQGAFAPFTKKPPKPPTRTVGIGDGNVFDDGLRIHEKELRTVIIGKENVGKRNVGVDCRVATRDVGMTFSLDDEKPATRSVGVNVDSEAWLTTLNIKASEVRKAMQEALHRSVRTVGVTCDFRPETVSTGVQYMYQNFRSIGVGEDSVEKPQIPKRSIGIDAQPLMTTKGVNTDYGWKVDSSTNTVKHFTENKAIQSDKTQQGTKSTMTEGTRTYHDTTQTEHRIFQALDIVRSTGCNTEEKKKKAVSCNTDIRELTNSDYGFYITYRGRNVNSYDAGCNTERKKMCSVGCGDGKIEFEDEPMMEETTEEVTYVTQTQIIEAAQQQLARGKQITRTYGTTSAADKSALTKELLEKGVVEIPQSSVIVQEVSSSEGPVDVQTERTHQSSGSQYQDDAVSSESRSSRTTYSSARYGTVSNDSLPSSGDRSETVVYSNRKFGSGGSSDMSRFDVSDMLGGQESSGQSSGQSGTEAVVEKKITSQGGNTYSITTITTKKHADGDDGDEHTLLDGGERLRVLTGRASDQSDNSSASHVYTTTRSTMSYDGDSSDSGTSSFIREQTTSKHLDGDTVGNSHMTSSESSSSGVDTSNEDQEEVHVITETYSLRDIGGQSYYEKYIKSAGMEEEMAVKSRQSITDQDSMDSRSTSSLKSCMKKSKPDNGVKRGITFAETVTGGYTSSSNGEESSDENASDTESTTSYEEGSYDGREGSIVYQCKDDVTIASGAPGAMMFDQNIREIFELEPEMRESCQILAKYLEDSTEVTTKQLNASIEVIKKVWFKASSNKLSDPNQVEDYLSSFNEISKPCLKHIVNLQDDNGNTAIHYAVSHCNFDIVNLLLDTGAIDLNKQNKAGYTATMLATLAYPQTDRQQDVIQRLFSMGDVNTKAAKDGQTALMLAVGQGRKEMVQMLLDVGANVNAQDNEGSTAVMCACEHGHTDIVKILLAHPDCDASIADNIIKWSRDVYLCISIFKQI
ncbi:uncharacterized protein LOC125669279 isoform X5 [Ostrea edulis]|uniref:uncharacterized protein LOC125669279 isoform X5 n=1 Tax=Ostrea edulis TaxID=37623 RepID=UPI0024AEB0EA|nr:uncharacterized protein LOC125669279 isoform X5 [Ostrea edulis]